MAFIEQQDILDASSKGLDIIYWYYPQAREAQSQSDKRFKIRQDEKTASASLKQLSDGIWVATDFGGDQTPRNGIQVCMHEENISFREALVLLAERYKVGSITSEINKPVIDIRPATAEEKETEYSFDFNPELSKTELEILGPRVSQEICNRYNVYSLKSFTYTKDRKTITTASTENYPIYIIDHQDSKKMYQPLNPEKQYRFRHIGNKPKDYISGLSNLIKAYEEYQSVQLRENNDENDEQEIKKLEEAIICSGERDALNVAGYGYYPLWMNSESAWLSPKNFKDIMRCVNKLYILPDIDATGIRTSIKLGLEYMDIHFIWLPETLKKYKDRRGKPRKDFLDYIEIYPSDYDFKKLITVAKPLRFWSSFNSKKGGVKYSLSSTNTRFFLQSNGFYQLENKNAKTGQMFVKINGNIVTEVQTKDIKSFLIAYCENKYLNNEVLELLLNTNRLSENTLTGLRQIEIDFTGYDHDSQYLFFKNKTWKITSSDIIENKPDEVSRYVWEDVLIPHEVKKLPPFFTIHRTPSSYDIDIHSLESKYFCFLINASRIHWRKDLEFALSSIPLAKQKEYRSKHKFSINAPNLNQEEIIEQKLHLINKIFSIGYMLHRHKSQSKAWCVFAMDNIVGEEGDSNGRSGKSAAYKALRPFMKSVTLSGRNPKLTDNPHLYDRVTEHTDYILVDDADQYLNYKFFFDSITGELIVNPKNAQSYEIPFDKAPKFVFTSNHAQRNLDPSLEARLLYTVFSDYYHQQSESNDYNETWSIRDDFSKDLYSYDYTKEEWNADFNFFAQCVQFYLSVPSNLKINPPMNNVNLRNMLAEMGQSFKDWADSYFDLQNSNVNAFIIKETALNDFINATNTKGWTTNKFTKALRCWCRYYGFTFNPKAFQNGQKRISRKVDGNTKDFVYIKTNDDPINPLDLEGDSEFDSIPEEDKPF